MEAAETKPATENAIEPSPHEIASLEIVRRYMAWSAAGGLLPMPGVDVAAILAIQLKMLADIAEKYEIPFRRQLGKEAIGALLGSFLPVTVAQASNSVIKGLPLIGPVVALVWQPGLAAASTWAIGKVFIQHFEAGGTFLDFNPEEVKAYFREQYEAARAGMTGRPGRSRAAAAEAREARAEGV